METSQLTGMALDWAVAKAQGAKGVRLHTYRCFEPLPPVWVVDWEFDWIELSSISYSTDWAHGGPIIEREGITVGPWDTSPFMAHRGAYSTVCSRNTRMVGPTPLIAAMRCFVASKLGDAVDVPNF